MFRISNNLIGCLNFLVFLISVPIFASGVWLATRSSSECEKLMQGRAIAIGVFLMVASLAGFIGACCRVTWLMWVYLVFMSLLILLQVCFIIFDLVITSKGSGGGDVMRGRGYKEYHQENYSHWFRDQVEDEQEWRKIRSCLVDNKVCNNLQESSETYNQFFTSKLSPIESGCCKPPAECGFVYHKPTVWTAPPTELDKSRLRSLEQQHHHLVLQLQLLQGWGHRRYQKGLEDHCHYPCRCHCHPHHRLFHRMPCPQEQ